MLWVKALHIMAVVTWFAGLFYLPRLFVYHAMDTDRTCHDTFKVMEGKLYKAIIVPSEVVVVVTGVWLLYGYAWAAYQSMGWLHLKLVLVAVLIVYQHYLGYLRKVFRDDRNTKSHVYYRMVNEFPTLILIAVVLLVVVKPF